MMKVTSLPFDKEKFDSLIERACNITPTLKEPLAKCYCINVYEYSALDICTFYCKNINGMEYTISIEVPNEKN